MRRIFILFGLIVLIMTFALTRPLKIKEHIVSNEEIAQYKNNVLQANNSISNEKLNVLIDNYIKANTRGEEIRKGMEFGKALKVSLITSLIVCIILFLFFSLKSAQYNEMFGSSLDRNTNNALGSIIHFLFGKWL